MPLAARVLFYLSTAASLFTQHVSSLILIELSLCVCVGGILSCAFFCEYGDNEHYLSICLNVGNVTRSWNPLLNSVWLMRHECQQCASSNVMCHCLSQHQRAHEDRAALQFTFYDVISARPGAPAALRSLQSRCLIPGLYSTHLERWLTYYPANQVGKGKDTHLHCIVLFLLKQSQAFVFLWWDFFRSQHLKKGNKRWNLLWSLYRCLWWSWL